MALRGAPNANVEIALLAAQLRFTHLELVICKAKKAHALREAQKWTRHKMRWDYTSAAVFSLPSHRFLCSNLFRNEPARPTKHSIILHEDRKHCLPSISLHKLSFILALFLRHKHTKKCWRNVEQKKILQKSFILFLSNNDRNLHARLRQGQVGWSATILNVLLLCHVHSTWQRIAWCKKKK